MGFLDAVEDIGGAIVDAGKGFAEAVDAAGPIVDKLLRAANSPILEGGQVIIAGMRRTTGTGKPDDGDQFGQGGQRFRDASDVLATAEPTDDWTGSGADAYATSNRRQQGRTVTMAGLDRQVQTVIAREAFQVGYHRGKLDDQSNWLADVGLTTFKLGLIPGIGPAMKAAAETQCVIAAVGSSAMELASLSDEVSVNAAAVQGLVGHYEQVGRSTGDVAPMSPPPPPPGDPGEDPKDGPPDGDEAPPRDSPGEGPTDAPGGGGSDGGGGGSSGGGGAPSGGGGPASVPPPAAAVPSMTAPAVPAAPMTGGGPAAAGGVPAAMGGLPSAPGGAPAGAGGAAMLGQLIQAAVQRALDQRAAQQARDEKDAEDREKELEDPAKDEDGDGIPDAEQDTGPEAAPGAQAGGRAPIHVEFDVDPERLATPMTVTLDRDRSIVVPPTTTT
ncbi:MULTISPECIES: EspA/EspE family type VII secretion system effector [unclassified Mycobacterium]|uniref:EspA/EspE family type VII secretion system effector n=1 Tax=unclassified Mycobacterium TaxID=2642494 RepID=UPI0029C8D27B|nr:MULTISPECIES: EspA/EspE family type VII secretion system effector [unclassified Mycobacterium]